MKKILLAVAILALGVNLQAQEGLEGRSFIMGQVGYSQSYNSFKSDVNKDSKEQKYSVLPAYGYFISPSVAIGGAVGYQGSKNGTGSTKVTSNEFVIQPFARKYWNVGNNLYLFGQASVPFSFGDVKAGNIKQDYTTYGFEIKPGIDYFLSKNWSLEATVGLLSWTAVNPKGGSNVNNFDFGINSGMLGGLNLGVKYVF